MKTKIFIGCMVVLWSFGVAAQECSGYFALQKGLKMELVSYDKKDKPAAILKYEVVDYKPVNGGISLSFSNQTYDGKGKLLAKGDVSGKCVNGEFYSDVRNIGSEMLPKSADIEVNVTGDQLIYPNNLKAGQKLKDAVVTIKSGMKGGMTLINMTVTITDRTVQGFETVETPAGKFECAKITFNTLAKLMGKHSTKTTEYMAKGIGVVKSEQYDEKGKKISSLVLTKLEKP